MSEHKGGDFLRSHKEAEIIGGSLLITAAIAVGINTVRRRNRQMGVPDEKDPIPQHDMPLEERARLFGYEPESDEEPDALTKVTAFFWRSSRTTAERAIADKAVARHYKLSEEELAAMVKQLKDYNFLESAVLHSDKKALAHTATSDLNNMVDEELSLPLLRAISELDIQ